nr:VCBS repeat-containing protein [candidate division Zixibacteria bacterium]
MFKGILNNLSVILCLTLGFIMAGQMATGSACAADEDLSFEVIKLYPDMVFAFDVVDLDNDGYIDIVYVGFMMDMYIHIMFGSGDGTFEEPVVFNGASQYASSVITEFINADSLIDIVTSSGDRTWIYLNNGDRTFTVRSLLHGNTSLAGLATGYFNNDAYPDLISAYYNLYLGDGTGDFPSMVSLPFYGQTVYTNDFSNDGIDDILALDPSGEGGIYLNDGFCNFTQASSFDLGALTLAASINEPFADFNLDGNADFAFVTPIDEYYGVKSFITVGLGDGNGGITSLDTLYTSGTAYSLAIADIDQDNNLDLVASDATNGILVMFRGFGDGTFADSLQIDMSSDSATHAMATGDLDRDGNPDFICGPLKSDSIAAAINMYPDKAILSNVMTTTGYSNVSVGVENPLGMKISKNYRTVAGAAYERYDVDNDNSVDEQAVDYNLQNGRYKIVITPRPNASTGETFSTDIRIGNKKATLFRDYELPAGREELVFYYTVEPVSSIQPENGQTGLTRPNFNWSGLIANPDGLSYQFQLDRYYDFRSPIIDIDGLSRPEYKQDSDISPNSLYYWRFRTFDGVSWSDYSDIFAVYIVDFICGDADGGGSVNLLDAVYLIHYLYRNGPPPDPESAGNVNQDNRINLLDVGYIINYLHRNGPEPVCQ